MKWRRNLICSAMCVWPPTLAKQGQKISHLSPCVINPDRYGPYYSPEAENSFVILPINIFFLFSSKHQQIVNSNNCTCHLKKWKLFLIDVQVVIVNGGWRILFIKRKCTSHVSGVVPIAWSITRPIGRKLNSNDMETRNGKHVLVGRCPTTSIVKKLI